MFATVHFPSMFWNNHRRIPKSSWKDSRIILEAFLSHHGRILERYCSHLGRIPETSWQNSEIILEEGFWNDRRRVTELSYNGNLLQFLQNLPERCCKDCGRILETFRQKSWRILESYLKHSKMFLKSSWKHNSGKILEQWSQKGCPEIKILEVSKKNYGIIRERFRSNFVRFLKSSRMGFGCILEAFLMEDSRIFSGK